jgi:hypothetical protein
MDNIHTHKECKEKLLLALKTPQHIKDSLGDINKKYTAYDLLEQLIPLMQEAENCFELLCSDSNFKSQWKLKLKENDKS